MRAELTPTQMAEHLAKRKELWGMRKESGADHPTLTGHGNKQFAADTSGATSLSKRAVNMALARARDNAPEVMDEVRGTDMDKGVVLDESKDLPKRGLQT
jgi:hypothetical protein